MVHNPLGVTEEYLGDAEFLPGHRPGGSAGSLVMDGTLTRRTGETSNQAQTLAEHQRLPVIVTTT